MREPGNTEAHKGHEQQTQIADIHFFYIHRITHALYQ